MENISTAEPIQMDQVRMEAEMRTAFSEIQNLRDRMQRDQAQIEASGVRTDANLTEIQNLLAKLQAS